MVESPLFFDRGPVRLFGVWHQPAAATTRLPFVFCHPMAEEKLWAHRVMVSFARELAGQGHHVLRFDYAGNGDSALAFSESTLGSAVADIEAAVDLLKSKAAAGRVALLGLRLGASLACRVAAARSDVEALVLWAPIADGQRYLQELLRINLTTQLAVYGRVEHDREALLGTLAAGGTVNVDGYEFSRELADELGALALLKEPPARAARGLVLQVERAAAAKPSAEMQSLAAHLQGASLAVVQEDPFWKEIPRFYQAAPDLFARTLGWLENA